MEKEKSKIRRRRESLSAASKAFRAERSNASHTNNGTHRRHGSQVDNLEHANRRSLSRNLDSSFLSVDKRENIIPKTPEAVLVQHKPTYSPHSQHLETQEKVFIELYCRD
jgi:hypothetical protein